MDAGYGVTIAEVDTTDGISPASRARRIERTGKD
jgi:hypothetical protein